MRISKYYTNNCPWINKNKGYKGIKLGQKEEY